MAKSISTTIRGEELTLYGRKAVYWHAKKTLMLADTHWGKAEVFQQHGIPIPSTVLDSDLDDIARIAKETGAERILVLGDLLHSAKPMSIELQRRLAAWREQCPVPILSIRGNHDPKTDNFPAMWGITWVNEPYVEAPFCFRHEPKATKGLFTWCGHVHPVLSLGPHHRRLPCFWVSKDLAVLPSFGTFTGGYAVRPKPTDEVYVVTEGEVFPLHC